MRERKKMKICEGRTKWINKFSCPCCVTDQTKVGLFAAILGALNATELFLHQIIEEYGMRLWAREDGIFCMKY